MRIREYITKYAMQTEDSVFIADVRNASGSSIANDLLSMRHPTDSNIALNIVHIGGNMPFDIESITMDSPPITDRERGLFIASAVVSCLVLHTEYNLLASAGKERFCLRRRTPTHRMIVFRSVTVDYACW